MAIEPMAIEAELRTALAAFDGKATSFLTEAKAHLSARPGYHAALVALAGDAEERVSTGATWLIKHELETGWSMPSGLCLALTAALDGVTRWDAALHLCQSAHMLDLPDEALEVWRDWLMPLLSHDRPFLRAWSLDALCHLAEKDAKFERDAASILATMGDDTAASVRARTRAIAKRRANIKRRAVAKKRATVKRQAKQGG